jgi:hypothetical protein
MHFLDTFILLAFISRASSFKCGYSDECLVNSGESNKHVSRIDPNIIWPNKTVPYEIHAEFTDQEKVLIQIAIEEYNYKTCLNWVPRNGQLKYASFEINRHSTECGAYAAHCVDDEKLIMKFLMNPGCPKYPGIYLHEMGHLACLEHEQERLDRDNFVRPYTPDCSIGPKNWDSDHLYDYLSVMHYPCDENLTCMKPTRPDVPICGQFAESQVPVLTAGDAEKINDIFQCPGCLSYRFRYTNLTSPSEAFNAGSDASAPFICRGYAGGNIFPGKASFLLESCWISNDGGVVKLTSEFEVLTNPADANLIWIKTEGFIPDGAIEVGRNKINEPVFAARCELTINGRKFVTTGRVVRSNPLEAFFPFEEVEYSCNDFEILICQ